MFSFASSTLNKLATTFQSSSSTSTIEQHWQQLPEYTLKEVSMHDTRSDCWLVVDDLVYNVSDMLRHHPGGDDVLLEQAGRDATIAFHSVGHSTDASQQMSAYLIGILPLHERMGQLRRRSF